MTVMKKAWSGRLLALAVFALPAAAAAPAAAAPAEVILIRHGEKPAQGSDLSDRGYQRARALVGFFQDEPAVTRFGPPAAIYAEKPRPDGSRSRPLETVEPLADALGLQVDTEFKQKDAAGLARAILGDPAYDGKLVLVCWEHHELSAIAQALGLAQAPAWPDGVFDRAWVLDYQGEKVSSFRDIPQRLLPGDSRSSAL